MSLHASLRSLHAAHRLLVTASSDVKSWAAGVEQQLGLKSFYVYETGQGDWHLDSLIVPKETRKTGLGSKAVQLLCDKADAEGKRITLSPGLRDDNQGTTSRTRLVRFYKRFGFVENKGRRKDFTIREGMYREPANALR